MQVSRQHRALVIPHRRDIENLISHARRFTYGGQDLLAIPHGADEVRLLRNLGIEAPAPILWQYDWCGDTPFETQRKTAALLTTNRRAYVLSEMGTGKTRAALHALNYLIETGRVGRALICAPLSTLTTVWQQEVFNHFPKLSACVLYGPRQKRLKLLRTTDANVLIINHDGVQIIVDEICQKYNRDISALIIDELAVYRSPKANRSKLMRSFAKRFDYVWGMTGSPTPNAPTDAWAQAKIVTPERAPTYFKAFKESTMLQVSNFIWVPRKDSTALVADLLKPCVRFTRAETVELPPVSQATREIPLSTTQKRVYEQLLKHAELLYANHRVTAVNEGVLLSKLLQVACGSVYSNKGVIAMDATARLQALTDIIEEAGQKVLVFVPFVHALKRVSEHVAKQCSVAVVSGETKKAERDQIFQRFQTQPDPHVIVAHPGTMSHGLTLTAANCIVWYAPIPSLEMYEQAKARISRPGQKHKQFIINLCATPAERKLYRRLKNKATLQGLLLELLEGVDEGL